MTRHAALLAAVAFATAGCGEDEFGSDIGRPPITPVDRPEALPLVIEEVFAADADTSKHYAVLASTGSAGVELAGLVLCDSDACDRRTGEQGDGPGVELDGTLSAGARRLVQVGELDLSASAGELAVVDTQGVVHAYLAWGAAPQVLGSTLAGDAVTSGALRPGDFVELPFPMPTGVAAVSIPGGEQGCAAGRALATDTGVEPPLSEAPVVDSSRCPETPAALAICQTGCTAPLVEGGTADIVNLTAEPLRLYGVRLCAAPSCASFGPEATVAAAATVVVHLGESAPDSPAEGHFYFPAAAPLPASGDLLLLAPGSAALQAAPVLSVVTLGGDA